MGRSPEMPPADHRQDELDPDEEREITRKWYNDASFEGRTSNEFQALREELRKAETFDFLRYREDDDYRRLIHENRLLQDFIDEETLITLSSIYEHRDEIGLSEDQFEKLLRIFGDEVREKFHEEIETGEILKEMYRQFTPEEIEQHRKESLDTMKKEIDLQEQNIPHASLKPSLFPKKGGRQ